MSESPRYWFRAKRYGWGWGLPATWQGWVALVAFMVLLIGGAWIIRPDQNLWAYYGWSVIVSAALLAVCWFKGEPPRWRWGGD